MEQDDRDTSSGSPLFLAKRVPDLDTFLRQLAVRFTFAKPDFKILIVDATNDRAKPVKVNPLDIPLLPGSKIDLSSRPVIADDGTALQVSGWLGMAKEAYKNEEMMGVRIYARGKIAGVTRDFNQPAGFTGEFAMRSYLVGQVEAEWLDLDHGDDLSSYRPTGYSLGILSMGNSCGAGELNSSRKSPAFLVNLAECACGTNSCASPESRIGPKSVSVISRSHA